MQNFFNTITEIYGERGKAWLKLLPTLLNVLAQKWNFSVQHVLEPLSYNYVLAVRQNSTYAPLVLKLGLDTNALEREARTLSFYSGQGAAKLIHFDKSAGALLIEYINPGTTLRSYFSCQSSNAREEKSLNSAADVIKCLHTQIFPPPHSFKPLEELFTLLYSINDKNLPTRLLKKAQTLSQCLLISQATPVVLHGDLHHDNILFSEERGWLAIDPKGFLGEPLYEAGAFIRNPFPEVLKYNNLQSILTRRIDFFAELFDAEKKRLKEWCFVQAVLSACWSAEDNQIPRDFLLLAELFETL